MRFFPKLLFCVVCLLQAVASDRIVSCHVVGGLGNQLFQIANALAVAWDYGYEPIFPKISQAESYLFPRPVYWDSIFHKIATYDPNGGETI